MYLFFDTETNGLLKTEIINGKSTKVYPRVIQLAYILLNDNFEEVQSYCELIYPDGWEIPNDRFWIENGYSTEQNKLKGVNIRVALNFFSAIG